MTNVKFSDISAYRDVETTNMYYERIEAGYKEDDVMRSIYAKSRDNARTPMQWNGETNAGFTKGTPWIGVNPNYTKINAEDERKDTGSVYQFYRKLIRLRKEYPVFVDGKFELLLPEDEHIFAYTRTDGETEALICANFTGKNVKCPIIGKWKDAQVLIHNYEKEVEEELEPYEAVILVECL